MAPRIVPNIRHYFATVRKNTVFTTVGAVYLIKVGNLITPSDCHEYAVTECFPSDLGGKFAANRCSGKHTDLYKRTQACYDICMLLVKTISRNEQITHSVTHRPRTGMGAVSRFAESWDRCCIYGTNINI